MSDLRDFIGECGHALPSIPVHSGSATYCSKYCRDWFEQGRMKLASFGWKFGSPLSLRKEGEKLAVFDARQLPDDMAGQGTGLQRRIRGGVLKWPEARRLRDKVVKCAIEHPDRLVTVGCEFGRCRSVSIVESAATQLRKLGHEVTVTHRELT